MRGPFEVRKLVNALIPPPPIPRAAHWGWGRPVRHRIPRLPELVNGRGVPEVQIEQPVPKAEQFAQNVQEQVEEGVEAHQPDHEIERLRAVGGGGGAEGRRGGGGGGGGVAGTAGGQREGGCS